jgi:hypothetical protein
MLAHAKRADKGATNRLHPVNAIAAVGDFIDRIMVNPVGATRQSLLSRPAHSCHTAAQSDGACDDAHRSPGPYVP